MLFLDGYKERNRDKKKERRKELKERKKKKKGKEGKREREENIIYGIDCHSDKSICVRTSIESNIETLHRYQQKAIIIYFVYNNCTVACQ